ncbi:barstar family protein [Micromonospora sp. NPDC049903]|uniref:barstar family protein n=1 Tax=Micromonospora sp. NPDC049903 TaxID=3364276 RepID=UPI0037AF7509
MWNSHQAPLVVARNTEVKLSEVLPSTGAIAVTNVDGRSMADLDAVFTQFYDGLRFPTYFGWNWPAFSELLRDLSWLSANRFLIVVDNADLLLRDEPIERPAFFRILKEATRHWAGPGLAAPGEPSRMLVLLVCEDSQVAELEDELRAAR